MKPESIKKFATLVKEIRIGMGLSQQGFADLVGVAQASFQVWEAGKIKTEPKARYLKAIADLKGWTVDELMAYLEGTPLIPDKISMAQLLSIIKELSPIQAIEVGKFALSVAERNIYYCQEKSDNIKFSRGASDVTFSQFLQSIADFLSEEELSGQLNRVGLPKVRWEELIAGNSPTNAEIKKIGGIVVDIDFKDANGLRYTLDRLEAMRAGRYTNGASR